MKGLKGFLLHTAAASVIVTATIFFPYLAIPAFAILGFFWEKTQHRYVWSVVDGKLQREETGWFGWFKKRRILEGSGWPAGAAIGFLASMIIRAVLK